MLWLRVFVVSGLLVWLAGCGVGGGESFRAESSGRVEVGQAGTLPIDPALVRVTVRTDYSLAHKEIRFLQVEGDPDFLAPVTLTNQGFEFWFELPKGYAYQITFSDIPSIDEPAPWEFTLSLTHPDTLDSPAFRFVIHP